MIWKANEILLRFATMKLMKKNLVEKIPLSSEVRASVVIPHFYPSREQNLQGLIEQLRRQSFKNLEVIVAHQISPQGKAINEGARQAQGEILIVMDDDSQMDDSRLIEKLIQALESDPLIAMAGASIISPENINSFQRAAAKQFPRFHMPVVDKVTDSDLACHGCVAFRKKLFDEVGMERDNILRGLDPDLRVRFRKAGYRVVLVPQAWVYHPFPATVWKFIRLFIRRPCGENNP